MSDSSESKSQERGIAGHPQGGRDQERQDCEIRRSSAVVLIILATGWGLVSLASRVLALQSFGKSQAAVLCVIVIGWVAVALAGLFWLSRHEDGWR